MKATCQQKPHPFLFATCGIANFAHTLIKVISDHRESAVILESEYFTKSGLEHSF